MRPTEVSGKTHLHNKNKLQQSLHTKTISGQKLLPKEVVKIFRQ